MAKKHCKLCENPIWARGLCLTHDKIANPDKYRLKKKPSETVKKSSGGLPVKKKRIAPVSAKRAEELKIYRVERDKFLKENPACKRCGSKDDITLHHMVGKIGKRLYDSRYFCTLCFKCHRFVEENPQLAKEGGYSLDRLSID
jgi:ribosomal protein S27AE